MDRVLHTYTTLTNHHGQMAQFHAGLYCAPAVNSGTLYNDDLLIAHVDNENDAIMKYMSAPPNR